MASNGAATAAAPPTSDPLQSYIDGLEGELAPLTARRAQLQAEINEIAGQEQRIKDALAALRPQRRVATGKPSKNQWTPSTKTQDDVYAALAKLGKPSPVSALVEPTGISRGTVEKALQELRKADRVRFCGQGGQGNANLYDVMPSRD